MAGGRPEKTVAETLPEDWKENVLALYAEGGSDVEIRVLLDISQGLFNRWMKDEEEFLITITKGREICQAWWERQGRVNLTTPVFQSANYQINMRNRFGWDAKDKKGGETEGDKTKVILPDGTILEV